MSDTTSDEERPLWKDLDAGFLMAEAKLARVEGDDELADLLEEAADESGVG